jgi:hypothetical protein
MSDISWCYATIEITYEKDFKRLKKTKVDVLFFLDHLPGSVADEYSWYCEDGCEEYVYRCYGEECVNYSFDVEGIDGIEKEYNSDEGEECFYIFEERLWHWLFQGLCNCPCFL